MINRKFALIGLLLLCGCSPVLSGRRNEAIDFDRTATTRIVYGVADDTQPRQLGFLTSSGYTLSLRQVNQSTGSFVCTKGDHNIGTGAAADSSPSPLRYYVFDMPAGAYAFSGPMESDAEARLIYSAPKGQTVYIGDYRIVRTETGQRVRFSRNIVTAKKALGPRAETMTLASASADPAQNDPPDCGRAFSYDYIKPVATFSP